MTQLKVRQTGAGWLVEDVGVPVVDDDDIDLALDDPEPAQPVYLHPVARRAAAVSFGAAVGSILGGIGYVVFGGGNAQVVVLVAVLLAVAFALFGLAAEMYATKDDRDYLVGEYVDEEA